MHRPTDVAELHCSFCGKPQSAVAKLIAGTPIRIGAEIQRIAICNECVDLCREMIDESLAE